MAATLYHALLEFYHSREIRFWPSAITFVGTLVLLGLGSWQLLRLQEKNTLLQGVELHMATPPADFRQQQPPQSNHLWQSLHYHPIVVKGQWLNLRRIRMAPRTYSGQVGYHLIVPLRLENGLVMMVNRGFVKDGAAIIPEDERTIATISGIARIPEPEKSSRFTPENVPNKGVWVWNDLAAMAHEIGVNRIAPVILYENRNSERDSYPIGGQVPLPSHNRHKQYAITWYFLAFAFIGVWIMASGPKSAQKPEETQHDTNDDMIDPVKRRGMYPEATD